MIPTYKKRVAVGNGNGEEGGSGAAAAPLLSSIKSSRIQGLFLICNVSARPCFAPDRSFNDVPRLPLAELCKYECRLQWQICLPPRSFWDSFALFLTAYPRWYFQPGKHNCTGAGTCSVYVAGLLSVWRPRWRVPLPAVPRQRKRNSCGVSGWSCGLEAGLEGKCTFMSQCRANALIRLTSKSNFQKW